MRNDERWYRRNYRTAWRIQEPSAPQEVDYLHWLNQKAIAETILNSVSDAEKEPLLDLLELHAVRGSEHHYGKHGRQFNAEQFETIKQKMIEVGAPAALEFMGDMEAIGRYTLFLNSRYPALEWSAVRYAYIENPEQPQHPDSLLPNEWLLDIEESAKLGAILTHDTQTVLGEVFNPDLDYLFQRWFMVGGMNDLHNAYQRALALSANKPVSGVSSSLDSIITRSDYYANNIELLATHNKQFYPSQNPYEPLVSWNPYETQIMRLMVAMERHYDWLAESLTNGVKTPKHQSRQNPLARLKNATVRPSGTVVNPIAFEASGSTATPDPVRDTELSTPEAKEEAQKAIANTGEKPVNSIAFGGSDLPATSDPVRDTELSTPAVNEEAQKAIANTRVDAKTLLESGTVFTSQEAAIILSLSVKQITALIRSNELPAVKIGRGYRIKRENIEKLTEQRYKDPISQNQDKYDDDMGF